MTDEQACTRTLFGPKMIPSINSPPYEDPSLPVSSSEPNIDHIFFKHDRIYCHNIMRINYTTYDVYRGQDTINPNTSHRDIMVLANDRDDPTSTCRFLFARVVGIYHMNVIYTGPGMMDYHPRRMEVLWVWWYQQIMDGSWTSHTLDRICFPPMASENAFGFLDPSDVLRGCHVIPAFAKGEWYINGQGLSRCARDSQDWHNYYVNRCVITAERIRESVELIVPLSGLSIAI